MAEFMKQFERTKRSLNKIENQDRNLTEYNDDLWHFFQDCYHLKDWIKNDPRVSINIKGKCIDNNHKEGHLVEQYVEDHLELKICADLAIRSKHLTLLNKRVDAKLGSIESYAPTIKIIAHDGSELLNTGLGASTKEHFVTTDTGNVYDALEVAHKAVGLWSDFLNQNKFI